MVLLEILQENISKGLPTPWGRDESSSNFSHKKLSEGLFKPSHALVLMMGEWVDWGDWGSISSRVSIQSPPSFKARGCFWSLERV